MYSWKILKQYIEFNGVFQFLYFNAILSLYATTLV